MFASPNQLPLNLAEKNFFASVKPEVVIIPGVELETLIKDSDCYDYEPLIFQSLVNEGSYQKVLSSRKSHFHYDEKELRNAAAVEVANTTLATEETTKSLSKKRKSMDVVEKVQDCRDRNREHAKNTRLRKKAYVIKLKELAEELEQYKNQEETEKRSQGLEIINRQITQKNVVRLFLSYRERNMQERNVWEAILEENFVFTLPITPYRAFLKRDVISGNRMLVGIDAVIADCSSLYLMIESVGGGSPQWKESIKRGITCRLMYEIDNKDFHCASDIVMCRYSMHIEGYKEMGANSTCIQSGSLLCRFNNITNKLASVEMVFDVMGFMQQLQRASALTPENSVVPNTVDMALQASNEARAIITTDPPFPVLHINSAFSELSGMCQSDVEGLPFTEVLKLMPSQFEHLYAMVAKCLVGQVGSAVLITQCPFTPDQPSLVYLKMFPLTSNTETTITHFLGIHTDLPLSVMEKKALLLYCKNAALQANNPIKTGSISTSSHIPDIVQSSSSVSSTTAVVTSSQAKSPTYNNNNNNNNKMMIKHDNMKPMSSIDQFHNAIPLPIVFTNNRFYDTSNNTSSFSTFQRFHRMTDISNNEYNYNYKNNNISNDTNDKEMNALFCTSDDQYKQQYKARKLASSISEEHTIPLPDEFILHNEMHIRQADNNIYNISNTNHSSNLMTHHIDDLKNLSGFQKATSSSSSTTKK